MRAVVVSNRAETDLRGIWGYSFNNWGEAQADRYLDQLDDGLQACGADVEGGKQRDDVRTGYWSRFVNKHVVFYTFTNHEVIIQRVLHGSMDPALHVFEDESEH